MSRAPSPYEPPTIRPPFYTLGKTSMPFALLASCRDSGTCMYSFSTVAPTAVAISALVAAAADRISAVQAQTTSITSATKGANFSVRISPSLRTLALPARSESDRLNYRRTCRKPELDAIGALVGGQAGRTKFQYSSYLQRE